jgi:hypothetical protein
LGGRNVVPWEYSGRLCESEEFGEEGRGDIYCESSAHWWWLAVGKGDSIVEWMVNSPMEFYRPLTLWWPYGGYIMTKGLDVIA